MQKVEQGQQGATRFVRLFSHLVSWICSLYGLLSQAGPLTVRTWCPQAHVGFVYPIPVEREFIFSTVLGNSEMASLRTDPGHLSIPRALW